MSIELVPGGSTKRVTNDNKDQYVRQVVELHSTRGRETQIRALRSGFSQLIQAEQLAPFTAKQLGLMLCGVATIDVSDWKENTLYENGYTSDSPEIAWFWEIVEGLTADEHGKLVQFATGTTRVPASGFAALEGSAGPSRFSIYRFGLFLFLSIFQMFFVVV